MRMLRVPICVCLLAGLAVPLGAGVDRVPPSLLTVILDFKGPLSRTSLKEMERESGLIMRPSGVRLDWRMLGSDPSASYNDLVVVKFRGACEYEPAAPIYDELGPLALTHTTDGEVQPFGEVDCDHLVGSVRTAMSGFDYARADLLVGRAMGRVVAHELVHMLTKSGRHGAEGVFEPALSGKQLIGPTLPLDALDINRVKQQFGRR
jgi:hypothetical protein